jgi:hypothetical protein
MADEQNQAKEEYFASWEIPEYHNHDRDLRWYVIAISLAVVLIIFSIVNANYLLPVIIIIAAFIMIMRHGQEPDKVTIHLAHDGLILSDKFYDYHEFKHFSVVYKPRLGDKKLYFEFNNVIKQRLSIPLMDMDPDALRDFLLTVLPEDDDRNEIPLSEQLSKKLKL